MGPTDHLLNACGVVVEWASVLCRARLGLRPNGYVRGLALCLGISLAVFLPLRGALAQDEQGDIVPEIWVDYNPSYALSPKLDLYGDIGLRTQLESGGWWRFVLRPNVRYNVSKAVIVAGGIGSFYTWNEDIADRWEIRPWQGVTLTWPRNPLMVQQVVRLEERFDFNTRTWESLSSLRLRYRLRLSKRWAAYFRPDQYWQALGSIEFFARLAGNEGQSQEQIRVTAGVERSYPPEWRGRVEVTWQKAGLFLAEGSFSEIFLRLRVFQKWLP